MAVINGTGLILYSEGVAIAVQKGCTLTVEQDLPDATNKESAGWAQHINGALNARIELTALFSSPNVPDMSAAALMNYIRNRETMLIEIIGLGYPIVAEADLSSLSFDAPGEGVMSLSGSLKVNGRLYVISGALANLVTDPDAVGTDYDTLTVSGIKITSAINAAGNAYCETNMIDIVLNSTYKLFTFITLTSGQLPSVSIVDNVSADISNVITLVEGLNVCTFITTTSDASARLRIRNTGAANWSTSNIYLVKV